jgi:hypothetical protein
MDIVNVNLLPGASEMQRLQYTMIGFFLSDEATNTKVTISFEASADNDAIWDSEFWVVDDDPTLAKLELAFPDTPIHNLKFRAMTSSVLSCGTKTLMTAVEVYARNAHGIISVDGELLSLRLTVSLVPDPASPLPDWKDILLLIRTALAYTYGQERGMITFDHLGLGDIKVAKRKGFRTLYHEDGVSMRITSLSGTFEREWM